MPPLYLEGHPAKAASDRAGLDEAEAEFEAGQRRNLIALIAQAKPGSGWTWIWPI